MLRSVGAAIIALLTACDQSPEDLRRELVPIDVGATVEEVRKGLRSIYLEEISADSGWITGCIQKERYCEKADFRGYFRLVDGQLRITSLEFNKIITERSDVDLVKKLEAAYGPVSGIGRSGLLFGDACYVDSYLVAVSGTVTRIEIDAFPNDPDAFWKLYPTTIQRWISEANPIREEYSEKNIDLIEECINREKKPIVFPPDR